MINHDRTVITIVNYDRKNFNVKATGDNAKKLSWLQLIHYCKMGVLVTVCQFYPSLIFLNEANTESCTATHLMAVRCVCHNVFYTLVYFLYKSKAYSVVAAKIKLVNSYNVYYCEMVY
jgi:hypothetical protein